MAAIEKWPEIIGVIMDGNRRYAKTKGLPRFVGHELGYRKAKEFIRWVKEFGIRVAYFYALSTENLGRSESEVGFLMFLFRKMLIQEVDEILREKVRIRFIGDRARLPSDIQQLMGELEEKTFGFTAHTVVIAVAYGGRAELVHAFRALGARGKTDITEDDLEKALWTGDLPPPELVIRTGGELRTSNFLPFQTVYSEWYFWPGFWPSLEKDDVRGMFDEYAKRERRNGL